MTDAGAAMGGYRYILHRNIPCEHECDTPCQTKNAMFIMLNPSTATEDQDGATIRRCMGFVRSWPGYGHLTVVNLFGLRATRPRSLKLSADPIGPLNDDTIKLHASVADLIVCAWGVNGTLYHRGDQVEAMLRERGYELHCLDLTKEHHPSHPLYARATLEPIPLNPRMGRDQRRS